MSIKSKRFELDRFYGYTNPIVRYNLSKKTDEDICREYDGMINVKLILGADYCPSK